MRRLMPLALALAAIWCLWVGVEPVSPSSALIWSGKEFHGSTSPFPATLALAAQSCAVSLLAWGAYKIATPSTAHSRNVPDDGPLARFFAALLIFGLTYSLAPSSELLLALDRPLGTLALLLATAVVWLLCLEPIARFERHDVEDELPAALAFGGFAALVWGVRAWCNADLVREFPSIFALASGVIRIVLTASSIRWLLLVTFAAVRRRCRVPWADQSTMQRRLGWVAIGLLATFGIAGLLSDHAELVKRWAIDLRVDGLAAEAVVPSTIDEFGRLERVLDQIDELLGANAPSDPRRRWIKSILISAWCNRIQGEIDRFENPGTEPGFLAKIDEFTERFGQRPFHGLVASWASRYTGLLHGQRLENLADLERASDLFPKLTRQVNHEQVTTTREILIEAWRKRIHAQLPESDGRDPAPAKEILAKAEKCFPNAWAAERDRLRAAWVRWFRLSLSDGDSREIKSRIGRVADEVPEARSELVQAYKDHVLGLLTRGPEDATIGAALRQIEARDPSHWDVVAIGLSPELRELSSVIEVIGTASLEELSKDSRFKGQDFEKAIQAVRRHEREFWAALVPREQNAGRFALALALAIKAESNSVTRNTLRRRAARDWFARVFAILSFPGQNEMPSLTADSAESLWIALVRSQTRPGFLVLAIEDQQGILFAHDGQFVYRKGSASALSRR